MHNIFYLIGLAVVVLVIINLALSVHLGNREELS